MLNVSRIGLEVKIDFSLSGWFVGVMQTTEDTGPSL
jgi:hypothetical protein